VIDFTEVDFVSSAGVGIFLGTVSKLRSAGGDLFFMRVPQQIQEVFDIINLKSHFRTIENIEQLETVEKS
jgi:anti-sigma B factor antagonist